MRPHDAYRVLGVEPSASPDEIRKAFRRLVKTCHPDRHASDAARRARGEEQLRSVIVAYRALQQRSEPSSEYPSTGRQEDTPDGPLLSVDKATAPPFRSKGPSVRELEAYQRRRDRRLAFRWMSGFIILITVLASWDMCVDIAFAVGIRMGVIDQFALPRLPSGIVANSTLADRAACYSTDFDPYYQCVLDRVTNRRYGIRFALGSSESWRLSLCARLQRTYSRVDESKCIAELTLK